MGNVSKLVMNKNSQFNPAKQSVQKKYPIKSSANVSRLCGIFLTFIADQNEYVNDKEIDALV